SFDADQSCDPGRGMASLPGPAPIALRCLWVEGTGLRPFAPDPKTQWPGQAQQKGWGKRGLSHLSPLLGKFPGVSGGGLFSRSRGELFGPLGLESGNGTGVV